MYSVTLLRTSANGDDKFEGQRRSVVIDADAQRLTLRLVSVH